MGLHAKSVVIDGRIGVVGTHNFDPRSETYNTEAVVVIEDPAFARALADSIRRDIAPGNSWTVAPREKPPGPGRGRVRGWPGAGRSPSTRTTAGSSRASASTPSGSTRSSSAAD